MSHRSIRTKLLAAAVTAVIASAPATASAQSFGFNSCNSLGTCGWVEAIFQGSILTVHVANTDNVFGSQLWQAQLFFAGAVNAGVAPAGTAFSFASSAATSPGVSSVGTVTPWIFSGVNGMNELDVVTFANSYLEGGAASPFRALPGDPDGGSWLTQNGYVEFTADLSSVTGANGGSLVGLGFCTDADCAVGTPVATPEPATLGLVATGFIGLVAIRRRRKNAV